MCPERSTFQQLVMQSPDSEPLSPQDSSVTPLPNFWGRWWIRISIFVLHLVALVAAGSLTPAEYAFQFGYYIGSVLLFSTIFLWGLLFYTRTRKGILWFCMFAIAQAGCVAMVGLHFQSEDRVLQQIKNEFLMKQAEWAAQMKQFSTDPLTEMTSGRRQLSVAELQELQTRARAGKAKLNELESDLIRLEDEAEQRIAKVSTGEARNFRRGVESSRPIVDEQMKLMRDNFTAVEQLTGFLIDRRGQYSQTSNGLVFKKYEDADTFNKQLDAITHLQEKMNSRKYDLPPD